MPRITVSERLKISVDKPRALAFLHRIENLADYEPKVDTIRVVRAGMKLGSYSAHGRFLMGRWKGNFKYRIGKHGFESQSTDLRFGFQVSGGFVVKALAANRCSVTHTERYDLPWVLAPFVPLFRPYLRRSIRIELGRISELVRASDLE